MEGEYLEALDPDYIRTTFMLKLIDCGFLKTFSWFSEPACISKPMYSVRTCP